MFQSVSSGSVRKDLPVVGWSMMLTLTNDPSIISTNPSGDVVDCQRLRHTPEVTAQGRNVALTVLAAPEYPPICVVAAICVTTGL